ncbi:MAG: Na+/H+ antiporter NhaC [Spirochaetales bacterium]|nr:Na+/H+ antiporter NhaC [Spirochaetales bacterium]
MTGFKRRHPGLLEALLPVAFLIVSLTGVVLLFGEDATRGPAQITLILAGFFAAGLAMTQGISWSHLENSIIETTGLVIQAILILLLVGALIGTWILAGIVPALIIWALELLSPQIFLMASAIICAIVSLATGSSWSTAGTLGLALVGAGSAMGLSPAITAGAIVSGSYFGDKLSPFSETTNLAASMAEVPLFSHIRHMLYTTIPAFSIALLVFFFLGKNPEQPMDENIIRVTRTLSNSFYISIYLMIPVLLLFALVALRFAAIPALLVGIFSGMLCAVLFQQEQIALWQPGHETFSGSLIATVQAAAQGFVSRTGDKTVDDLLSRGGMSIMLTTVWLILSAMFFSGIMEGSGMLQRIARAILSVMRSRSRLIVATLSSSVFMNVAASDQYLSIVLTGRMYRRAYDDQGLSRLNLSRALEDSGTLTSALVPWNTCGAFMATTLGVPTLVYLPYAILNWLNPLIGALYAVTGWTVLPAEKTATKGLDQKSEDPPAEL